MDSTSSAPLLPAHIDSDSEQNDDSIILTDRPGVNQPKDKFYIAFFVFYLLGMTTLFPWNFFITEDDYWMYKFRNLHNASNMGADRTPLQINFMSYLSVSSTVPNTLFLILNAFFSHRIPLQLRMVGSLLIMLFLFICTTIFVKINTDSWQQGFFVLTLILVVGLNISSAILSGGLFGIVGNFNAIYISALLIGQALGAVFVALADIISLTIGASSISTAFVYFMIGNSAITLSLISYVVLVKTDFFKYHMVQKSLVINVSNSETVVIMNKDTFRIILKKIWMFGFTLWFNFIVTLSVFPGLIELVESKGKGSGNKWNDVYFTPVVTYLGFSVGDFIGRTIAGFQIWPRKKNIFLLSLSIARLIFIPAFMLCNIQPRLHLPVLLNEDSYYIFILACFSISNGYLANGTMICTASAVESNEKTLASSLMGGFLGVGLSCGALLSLWTIKCV